MSTSLRHVRLSEDGKRVTVHSSEKGVDHELALNELVEVSLESLTAGLIPRHLRILQCLPFFLLMVEAVYKY